jgi:hypothetical protein
LVSLVVFCQDPASTVIHRRWLPQWNISKNPACLHPEYPFDPADFLLDCAGKFFASACGCHTAAVRDVTHFLLSSAFDFMKLAFDPIPHTRFHGVLLASLELAFRVSNMDNASYVPISPEPGVNDSALNND